MLSIDFFSQCLDEISLEGLDGATLSTFFWRLSQRPGFTFSLDEQGKRFLWDRVKQSPIIFAYCLPSPRPAFVPYKRNDCVDKESGMLIEPDNLPEDIYPTEIVDDVVNGIRGSCKTYKSRTDVTREVRQLSLQDAEANYGDRLVLVASQSARNRAILGTGLTSQADITSFQYTMLERLGRARYEGEISIGTQSFHNVLNISDKTCFYYRSQLLKYDLITRQRFVQKLGKMANSTHGQLFHLKRFFTKHTVRIPNIVQAVINKISESPNKMLSAVELRKFLPSLGPSKKLLRTIEFQRYIKSKRIQVDDEAVEIFQVEDCSDDEEVLGEVKSCSLDVDQRIANQLLLRQMYTYIIGCGSGGCTQVQATAVLGLNRLEGRALCRALLKMDLIVSVLRHQGEKSKCWTFVAKVFESQSTVVCGLKSQVQLYEEQKNNQKCKVEVDDGEVSYVIGNISVKLTQSQPQDSLSEQLYYNEMFLKRANFMIDYLQKHGVVPVLEVRKVLFEHYEKVNVDLKLITRLLIILVRDGLAKRIKAEMTAENGCRTVEFIADSSIPLNSPLLRSVVERCRDSFSVSLAIQVTKNEKCTKAVDKAAVVSKQYYQGSRFYRTQILHQMMFYLARGYTGMAVVGEERETFLKDLDIDDLPDIYKKEINWMTFMPCVGDSIYEGWISLWDILMRMPAQFAYDLGAFLEFDENVSELLSSPVKRYITTLQLDLEMQSSIFSYRFYSKLIETLRHLCALGLIQLGSEPPKKKQQRQIYVNQYASLWDTRSSASGYCFIEKGKTYNAIEYTFVTIEDVERYWTDLYKIGLTSNLGSRSQLVRDNFTKFSKDKEELIECFQSRDLKEAPSFDNGNLPGDRKGAAGTDSSLVIFKKTNWMCPIRKQPIPRMLIDKKVPEKLVASETKTVKKAEKKLVAKGKKRKQKQQSLRIVPKVKKERKPSYDEIDRIALRKMKKQRSMFSASEDCFLIMCRAAAMFLFPGSEFPLISHIGVRDILNRKFPSSEMKTTKACQRRINFMFKDETTRADAEVLVEEMRQEPEILKKFGHKSVTGSKKETLKILEDCLEPLVERMLERYKDNSFKSESCSEAKTLSQLKELYRFKAEVSASAKSAMQDVSTQSDIALYKAMNAVVSALANDGSEQSSLLTIYRQFSDDTLREAICRMHNMEIIAGLKKKELMSSPHTVSQYKLSCRFMFKFITPYQYEIYEQCWEFLKEIMADHELSEGVEATAYNLGGFTAAVASLMSQGKLVFSMDIPEHMLVLKSDDVNIASRVRGSKLWQTCQRLYVSDSSIPTEHLKAFNMSRKLIMLFRQQVQMDDPLDGHFLHHCLTVQSCKVVCRLYVEGMQEKEKESINIEHGDTKTTVYVDSHLLPQKRHCIARTLSNASNKVPQEAPTFQAVHDKCLQMGFEEQELLFLSRIYTCIYDGGSFGVTKRTLMETFQGACGRIPLRHHLKQLLKAKVIWIVGTEYIRYVAYEFINQWTVLVAMPVSDDSVTKRSQVTEITANKPLTDEDKQSTETTSNEPSTSDDSVTKRSQVTETTANKSLTDEDKQSTETTSNEPSTCDDSASKQSAEKPPTKRKAEETLQEPPSKKTKSSFKKFTRMIQKPWITADAELSKKVLDRMLGSLLSYMLTVPGCTLEKLSLKFQPALFPVQIYELVQLLIELECVTVIYASQKKKPSLFSCIEDTIMREDPGGSLVEEFYETTSDAIVKMAQFIGDKEYETDFMKEYGI